MACILSRTPILYRATYFKSVICNPIAQVIRVKNYGHFDPIKSDSILEKKLKLKDNISDDYKLIYREHTTIHRLIILSYNGGWLFLFLSILNAIYIIITDPTLSKPYKRLYQEEPDEKYLEENIDEEGRLMNTDEEGNPLITMQPPSKFSKIISVFGGIVTSAILIITTKTMPLRIYHSPKQKLFKGMFVSNIIHGKKLEIFSEGSAVVMFRKFMPEALFKINGRIVLLDKECFAVQKLREMMIHKAK
ncbi:PREDICTED: uncharacterized protein LOC106752214 [Dinoponera quadriceps]|uniref:Uncharacterized protein LOC106752214 n=1 Tax=Dinoponera quadriceps TaxID=609295 RepID=A0A6P3YFL6_DINQU|nr:PREDICTED: uncharacterized protein LOC106752214 [Dinoponera quadriceps]